MRVIWTLWKKEVTDALRDRRTLWVMLLLPVLLYPGVMLAMGELMFAGRARLSLATLPVAVCGPGAESLLPPDLAPPRTPLVPMDRASAEAALKEKRIWALVDAPADVQERLRTGQRVDITLGYTKRHDPSIEALTRVKDALEKLKARILQERLDGARLSQSFVEPLHPKPVDLDFQGDIGPLVASRALPLLLMVMLFLGSLYPAIDVTAGEKERGTLETLLVTPVHPWQVMLAKYFTVAFISNAVMLVNLLGMVGTFAFGLRVDENMRATFSFSAAQVLMLVVSLLPASLLISGMSLVVASLARNYKEAQAYLTPLTLVGMVPGTAALMPGLELNFITAWVPLLNVALFIKAVALETAEAWHLIGVFATVGGCAAFSVLLAANAFQSEALRFGGVESWRELFGRRRPMARGSIDRFEGDVAVLIVNGKEEHRKRAELAPDAREGDVIDLATGKVDRAATEKLRDEVAKARAVAMKGKPPTGSFDL